VPPRARFQRQRCQTYDWEFAGDEDAKMTIRAAVRYLLKGASRRDRGDIVVEIIQIVREAALGTPSPDPDPFDDDAPGDSTSP